MEYNLIRADGLFLNKRPRIQKPEGERGRLGERGDWERGEIGREGEKYSRLQVYEVHLISRRDTAVPCPYKNYVSHIPEKCCISRSTIG